MLKVELRKVEPYRAEIKYPIVPVRGANYLKAEVYYALGGYNYFTGKNESRGYYLSVSPVEIKECDSGFKSESYTAFTGYKFLLFEASRKSQKGMDRAIEMFNNTHMDFIKNYFSQYEMIQEQD